jgi:hypothetical protein
MESGGLLPFDGPVSNLKIADSAFVFSVALAPGAINAGEKYQVQNQCLWQFDGAGLGRCLGLGEMEPLCSGLPHHGIVYVIRVGGLQ